MTGTIYYVMTKKGFTFILLLLLSLIGRTQYFQTGQDPASIKWRQINTANFQLIYPVEFEAKAQKIAFIFEKVYNYGSESLNFHPKKISVILHTHTVKSNGLVALAPRRVELYTTPRQSLYPQDWFEQLAIHEFRHVMQSDKIEQQIPLLIRLLFGQQITAVAIGMDIPWWLLEGDAVATETSLSKYGRGRLPSFLMEQKAQVVEKGVYNYGKAYLGSYKDYVPNHYNLGYYLVGEARNRYGKKVWDNVFSRVGNKFDFSPVSNSLKQQTGFNLKKLYKHIFDSLRVGWVGENKNFAGHTYNKLSKPSKTFTNYKYNHYLPDGGLVTLKSSLKSIPEFIKIGEDGAEKKILTPGIIFDESVSCTGNLLTWAEQVPDPRWSHSGESLIHILNLKNGSHQKFKPVFKGFSPTISPDKEQIALVEVDYQNNYYLSVYHLKPGKPVTRFQTKSNNYFITPRWVTNELLATIILTDKGKRLAIADPLRKKVDYLTDESLGEIKHLVVDQGNILFISSYAGEDDLYAINIKSHSVYQIYKSRFGVEFPAVSPGREKIVLSSYSSNGLSLIEIPYSPKTWKPLSQVRKGSYPLAGNLAKQEKGALDFSGYNDTITYKSEKYRKLAHLFYFHSWAPVFFDVNTYGIQPGVSVMSQNILSTAETTLGYKWDVEEETGKFYAGFTYKGWYPVLSAEINMGKRASQYGTITKYIGLNNQVVRADTVYKRYTWNETTLELAVKVPLNLSRGKYYRLLQPEINYQLSSALTDKSTPSGFEEGAGQSLDYRLYYHQLMRQSYQDVYQNFGFIGDIFYRHSPFGGSDFGSLFSLQTINYFPGILPNHGISTYFGYQAKNTGQHSRYSDAIRYPRGWNSLDNKMMYTASVDYKFPLFYPDWSLGSIIYLKRLKASLFADYAHQYGDLYEDGKVTGSFSRDISSLGVEFTGDIHLLRFYAPIDTGFRAAYMPQLGKMHYALLFSIDFNSL